MKKRFLTTLCAVILLLAALPVQAAGASCVADRAGLLTREELDDLGRRAQAITDAYDCGLYIVTVEDYWVYGATPFEAACNIYRDWNLGVGADKDGLLLMLSMSDRDFATAVYGPWAHRVFTDEVLQHQEPEFLDDFGDDDWYEGFSDFLTTSEGYLETVRSGKTVDTSRRLLTSGRAAAVVVQDLLGGTAIALVICLVIKSGMRSVRRRADAKDYAVSGGETLSVCSDQFTHTTQTRRVIQTTRTSGGGGSRGFSGGGFSGRSGTCETTTKRASTDRSAEVLLI